MAVTGYKPAPGRDAGKRKRKKVKGERRKDKGERIMDKG
jgi:hypothetical protein